MRKCPYCAEEIQEEAIKCKHCGELLNTQSAENQKATKQKEYPCQGIIIASCFIPGLGQMLKGQIARGVVFLFLSLLLGPLLVIRIALLLGGSAMALGIGILIIALINARDAASPFWRCSKCLSIINSESSKCKHCLTDFA